MYVEAASRLDLNEWWQIHWRVPTHSADGREYTQAEFEMMVAARVSGCPCDPPCKKICSKGIDTKPKRD